MGSDDGPKFKKEPPPPLPGEKDSGSSDIDRMSTTAYDANQGSPAESAPPPTTGARQAITGRQPAVSESEADSSTTSAARRAITGRQPAISEPNADTKPLKEPDFPEMAPEDITSTGFIPNENFRAPNKSKSKSGQGKLRKTDAKKTIDVGKWTITIPSMKWLEDAEPIERLQYGGGGLLAGVVFGALLGILNALLQGWAIIDGAGQIFFLAISLGLFCAVLAALRPARADKLFTKLGLPED